MRKYLLLIFITITLSANNWKKINLEEDPFTGKKIVGFINISKNKTNQGKNIELIIRCGNKEYPEIIVNWNTFLHTEKVRMLERIISYDTKTEEKITKVKAKTEKKLQSLGSSLLDSADEFPVSRNFTSLFYPNISTIQFKVNYELELRSKLYDIVSKKTLLLKVSPYNNNPITAIFDLKGLKKLIAPYKDVCKLPNDKENSKIAKKMVENYEKLMN